jgi:hypothetical protein
MVGRQGVRCRRKAAYGPVDLAIQVGNERFELRQARTRFPAIARAPIGAGLNGLSPTFEHFAQFGVILQSDSQVVLAWGYNH